MTNVAQIVATIFQRARNVMVRGCQMTGIASDTVCRKKHPMRSRTGFEEQRNGEPA